DLTCPLLRSPRAHEDACALKELCDRSAERALTMSDMARSPAPHALPDVGAASSVSKFNARDRRSGPAAALTAGTPQPSPPLPRPAKTTSAAPPVDRRPCFAPARSTVWA